MWLYEMRSSHTFTILYPSQSSRGESQDQGSRACRCLSSTRMARGTVSPSQEAAEPTDFEHFERARIVWFRLSAQCWVLLFLWEFPMLQRAKLVVPMPLDFGTCTIHMQLCFTAHCSTVQSDEVWRFLIYHWMSCLRPATTSHCMHLCCHRRSIWSTSTSWASWKRASWRPAKQTQQTRDSLAGSG